MLLDDCSGMCPTGDTNGKQRMIMWLSLSGCLKALSAIHLRSIHKSPSIIFLPVNGEKNAGKWSSEKKQVGNLFPFCLVSQCDMICKLWH